MPCWEIRTISIEFKARNQELLTEVLKQMKLNYSVDGKVVTIRYGSSSIRVDLENEKVSFLETAPNARLINSIRVEYSKAAVLKAAKLRKWAVRKQGENKFQLVRS